MQYRTEPWFGSTEVPVERCFNTPRWAHRTSGEYRRAVSMERVGPNLAMLLEPAIRSSATLQAHDCFRCCNNKSWNRTVGEPSAMVSS